MRMLEAMIAWTPADEHPPYGCAKVGRWPDRSGWSDSYAMTDGACESFWHELDQTELDRQIAATFIRMAIRDRVDPAVIHAAFLEIDEYRQRLLSEDSPGFEHGEIPA